MKINQQGLYFIYGILSILMIYGFWPMTQSSKWEINEDEGRLNFKKEYLKNISGLKNDSLPNIIIIMADDLGISDLSLNGNENIQTKNIDKIAAKGIHFTNAYCSSPICATSRAGLLTGRYQNRFGFEYQMQNRYVRNKFENVFARFLMPSYPWKIKWAKGTPSQNQMKQQGLPKSEITIAELLKHSYDYKTACIGKWHLGKSEGKLPHNFGFDYHYGFYNSHSLFIHENSEGYIDYKNKKDWTDYYIWKDQRDGLSAIVRNGTPINENTYLTDRIAQESIDFITNYSESPFFLYIPFSAPHTPFQAPKGLFDEFSHIEDPLKRVYYAMIKSLDNAIGLIYDHLENNKLLDNTMIFIISDNGGARYTQATDNFPFKGGKVNYFEGGLRIPFIYLGKNEILPNIVNTRVSTLDIFSTIAHRLKLETAPLKLDGDNILSNSVLASLENRSLHWKVGNNNAIIEKDYKAIFNTVNPTQSRLYNLISDPTEQQNIQSTRTDIFFNMKDAQSKWTKSLERPLWPGVIEFKVEDDGETILFES